MTNQALNEQQEMGSSISHISKAVPVRTGVDISLIICTRDRPSQLHACLESVRRITFAQPWELILVDNGSAKQVADVINEFVETVSVPTTYVAEPMRGLGNARNAGVRAARGEILVFTDDDCYPACDYLKEIWGAFADRSMSYMTGRIMLHDPTDYPESINESLTPLTLPGGSFLRPGAVIGANMAFRRQVLLDIGGFDSLFGAGSLFSIEDLDAAARASIKGWSGRYVPSAVVSHHHRRKWSDVKKLRRLYAVGRGGYHMKLLLDQRKFLWFARSVYELWRNRIRWDWEAPLWETVGAAEYAYLYFGRVLRARLNSH